jgi:hypothetical protein
MVRGEVVMMLLLNPRNSPFVAGNFENGYDESLTTIKRPVLVRRAKEALLIFSS